MTTCAHHWDIAPANGPTSAGVCRNCGASKEFANHGDRNQVNQLHFREVNQANNILDGDIRAAEGLTRDYTRTW